MNNGLKTNMRLWNAGNVSLFPAYKNREGVGFDVMLNDSGSDSDWANPRYGNSIFGKTQKEVVRQATEKYGNGKICIPWNDLGCGEKPSLYL